MVRKFTILFCLFFCSLIFLPGWVFAQPVEDEQAVLEFLQQAFEANMSRLAQGQVTAEVSGLSYDPDGRKKHEDLIEATIVFKGQKSRLKWDGQWKGLSDYLLVRNEEVAYNYFAGDKYVFGDETNKFDALGSCDKFLPTKNAAFSYGLLMKNMSDDMLLSWKVEQGNLNGRDVYILDVVWKGREQDLDRYYVDPGRGAAILTFEYYPDFGEGRVRTLIEESEMQRTSNGAWYIKKSTRTNYQRDGKTLQEIEQYKIKNFDFVSKISDDKFTLQGMGLPPGTKFKDMQLGGIVYNYELPPVTDELFEDILGQSLVKDAIQPIKAESSVEPKETNVQTEQPAQKEERSELIIESNSNRGIQASSNRGVYLICAAVLALLLTIAALVIRRGKTQAGGIK